MAKVVEGISVGWSRILRWCSFPDLTFVRPQTASIVPAQGWLVDGAARHPPPHTSTGFRRAISPPLLPYFYLVCLTRQDRWCVRVHPLLSSPRERKPCRERNLSPFCLSGARKHTAVGVAAVNRARLSSQFGSRPESKSNSNLTEEAGKEGRVQADKYHTQVPPWHVTII